MTERLFLPALIAALATAASAHAQPPAAPPAGVEPPGFSFVGQWACEGAMASGRAHRSIYAGEKGAVPGTVELTETDVEPKGYVGRYILSPDPVGGGVAEADVNTGGVSVYRGPGWRDGRLELTTHDGGDFRFVFQVSDATGFEVTWQARKDGAWRDGDHLVCRKAS